MKNLMQLKDLIKNLAKEKNISSQVLLRNYMMQRLLLKISTSNYKNNFILKGGMLVADLVGIE
jgi:predicted nucleotidyltransferase component of viral defense system